MRYGWKYQAHPIKQSGGRDGFRSFALQTEHVVRADVVVFAQRPQMADGHFVDAVFVSGIHLLGGAEHMGHRALLDVPVFPQLAKDLPIFLHRITPFRRELHEKYIYTGFGVLTFTPDMVYNYVNTIKMREE